MRLYRLSVGGRARYAGTQADAGVLRRESGVAWTEVDVPTDKAGLLAFLNEHAPAAAAPPPSPPPVAPTPGVLVPAGAVPRALPALDAASVLARMDNPGLDIDSIVETIARMRGGYALKRVAGAVAIRFEELAR